MHSFLRSIQIPSYYFLPLFHPSSLHSFVLPPHPTYSLTHSLPHPPLFFLCVCVCVCVCVLFVFSLSFFSLRLLVNEEASRPMPLALVDSDCVNRPALCIDFLETFIYFRTLGTGDNIAYVVSLTIALWAPSKAYDHSMLNIGFVTGSRRTCIPINSPASIYHPVSLSWVVTRGLTW